MSTSDIVTVLVFDAFELNDTISVDAASAFHVCMDQRHDISKW